MARSLLGESSLRGRTLGLWNSSKSSLTPSKRGSEPSDIVHLGGSRLSKEEPERPAPSPSPEPTTTEFNAAQCGLFPPPPDWLDGDSSEGSECDLNEHLFTSLEMELPIQAESQIISELEGFTEEKALREDIAAAENRDHLREMAGCFPPGELEGDSPPPKPKNMSPPPLNLPSDRRPSSKPPSTVMSLAGSATSSSAGESSARGSPSFSSTSSEPSPPAGLASFMQSRFSTASRAGSVASSIKGSPPLAQRQERPSLPRSQSATDMRLHAQTKELPPPPPEADDGNEADWEAQRREVRGWGTPRSNHIGNISRWKHFEEPRAAPARPEGVPPSPPRVQPHRRTVSASSSNYSPTTTVPPANNALGLSTHPTVVAATTRRAAKPAPINTAFDSQGKPLKPSTVIPSRGRSTSPASQRKASKASSERSEGSRKETSQLPQLTAQERLWLHRQYRGEATFLRAWGLHMSKSEDREQGIVIMRELIADEKAQEERLKQEEIAAAAKAAAEAERRPSQQDDSGSESSEDSQSQNGHALGTIIENPASAGGVGAHAAAEERENHFQSIRAALADPESAVEPPRRSRSQSPGYMAQRELRLHQHMNRIPPQPQIMHSSSSRARTETDNPQEQRIVPTSQLDHNYNYPPRNTQPSPSGPASVRGPSPSRGQPGQARGGAPAMGHPKGPVPRGGPPAMGNQYPRAPPPSMGSMGMGQPTPRGPPPSTMGPSRGPAHAPGYSYTATTRTGRPPMRPMGPWDNAHMRTDSENSVLGAYLDVRLANPYDDE